MKKLALHSNDIDNLKNSRMSKNNINKKSTEKSTDKRTSKKVVDDAKMVSFVRVTEKVMGFRECSRLVAISKSTNTRIKLISGKKSGTSDSILSLTTMGLVAGSHIVMEIEGLDENSDKHAAFHEALEVITKGCSDPE